MISKKTVTEDFGASLGSPVIRQEATMLMSIIAICLSCIAIGMDIGRSSVVIEEVQDQPKSPQTQPSRTTKL